MNAPGFVLPPLARVADPAELDGWVRAAAKGEACDYAAGLVPPRAHAGPGAGMVAGIAQIGFLDLRPLAVAIHPRRELRQRRDARRAQLEGFLKPGA
jgi:hypothetical protein